MTKPEDIDALRKEIKKKEKELYLAEKDMSAWNSGKYRSHSNTQMSNLFIKSAREEIAEMKGKLRALKNQ